MANHGHAGRTHANSHSRGGPAPLDPLAIRDDILAAAASVFGELGYDRATLDEVAAVAGIKKGSLYYHIDSKEDLLLALHYRLADKAIKNATAALQGIEDPREQLRRIMLVTLELIRDHREESVVFLHERALTDSPRWNVIVAKRDEYEKILRGVLQNGIDAGVFRTANTKVLSFGILGMINWTYRWLDPGGEASVEEIAEQFSDVVINGIGVQQPVPVETLATAPAVKT